MPNSRALVERVAAATIAATDRARRVRSPCWCMRARLFRRRCWACLQPAVLTSRSMPTSRANAMGSIISDAGACAVIASGGIAREALEHSRVNCRLSTLKICPGLPDRSLRFSGVPTTLPSFAIRRDQAGQPYGVAMEPSQSHALGPGIHRGCSNHHAQIGHCWPFLQAYPHRGVRSIALLLNGASLHILPPLDLGRAALSQQIRARGITIYHSVPTLMRRIAEGLGAGERLDTYPRRLHRRGPRSMERCGSVPGEPFPRDVPGLGLTSTEPGPFIHGFVDDALEAQLLPAGGTSCLRTGT